MARCRFIVVAIAAVTLLGFGAVAQAFDITGTWEGTYKCKGTFGGEKDSFDDVLIAKFSQSGTTAGAQISFDGDLFNYTGIEVPNTAKPDKGDLGIVICGTDDDLTTGEFDEIGRLTVTTKPTKGTGSMKGTSLYTTTGPNSVYTCKWKLKRTDTIDPGAATTCL